MDYAGTFAKQNPGVCVFVAWICIGEMESNVAQGCCSEYSIAERMEGDIRITVAEQSEVIWNLYTADNKFTAFYKAMYIKTTSNSNLR